ncbi:unnamed protein product [Trichobilharzia regenti]|nr:unnamed protein product [Trichobilharzia regenti]
MPASCLIDESAKTPLPGDTLLMATARVSWESAGLFLLSQPECDPTLESLSTQGETVFHIAVESELFNLCKQLAVRKDINPNQLRFSKVNLVEKNSEVGACFV